MNGFEKIDVKQLPGNIFALFDTNWALITAGEENRWNTMTISWGQAGWLWGRPVVTAYVRKSRYTLGFTEARGCFTISFFDQGSCRAQLGVLGSKSGRDMDKMHESGLTPIMIEGEHAFAEARAVLLCRKVYADWIDPGKFLDPSVFDKSYADREDVHRMYVAEVLSAYVRK